MRDIGQLLKPTLLRVSAFLTPLRVTGLLVGILAVGAAISQLYLVTVVTTIGSLTLFIANEVHNDIQKRKDDAQIKNLIAEARAEAVMEAALRGDEIRMLSAVYQAPNGMGRGSGLSS